ncbi:MAG: hypothetical protein BWY43_00737 [candidate division WS2 bacterium ADurb.Bin280]|uniref:Uncharacterized protein n=1 Tax=candidate division WS2 bacterium ADurb.Bin280 TaxID=1852829 RepID=A0A1V5SC99_9BACT|nr:MAG: hypothetical protein BWY43_00737 [candidate division WS2 bacterium ADurb.Bin280]
MLKNKYINDFWRPILLYLVILAVSYFLFYFLSSKSDQISHSTLVQIISLISYTAVAMFVLMIGNSIIFALAYLSLNFSPRPSRIIFQIFSKKRLKKGKERLKIKIINNGNSVPFSDVTIFDEAENKLAVFSSNIFGVLKLRLPPGKYILQASNFGFESKATKGIEIMEGSAPTIELECFAKEDMFINPLSYRYCIFSKILYLLLSLGLILLFFFAQKYTMDLTSAFILISSFASFLIATNIKNNKIIVTDEKGVKLKQKEFTISDSTGKKKQNLYLSSAATANILVSEGIYKISAKGFMTRNLRVSKKSILQANLKLIRG